MPEFPAKKYGAMGMRVEINCCPNKIHNIIIISYQNKRYDIFLSQNEIYPAQKQGNEREGRDKMLSQYKIMCNKLLSEK